MAHAHAHAMLSAYNWNSWHTGSEGLAFFLGQIAAQKFSSQWCLLSSSWLCAHQAAALKSNEMADKLKKPRHSCSVPQAELSCRPLHQGWPPHASESEFASAKRWMKKQSCLGRRSLRSWAAVPSVLRPRPPNEYVASK